MPEFPALSDDQVNAALNLSEIELDIPDWKASIRLRAFSVGERDNIVSACSEKDNKIDTRKLTRLLVVHGVVSPKFTVDQVDKMAWKIADLIAKNVMQLNGMLPEKGPSAATVADVTF